MPGSRALRGGAVLKQPNTYRIKTVAMAVAFACLPVAANAAGLGRITVNSALGQPLRAELEITASSDELNSMTAKLASADAFRAAGIEYVPVLANLRFSREIVERNGKRYVQISTDRPLNEPFVDMLVELSWASGRLVREFTFLLDPPEAMVKTAPAPVAAPEVKAHAVAPATPAKPAAMKPAQIASPTATTRASSAPAGENTRLVKSGDTLRRIAAETVPAGVSLDQMLVALFKTNADAFEGNMNRMRAGKILSIPDAEKAGAISAAEARREVVAQASDFNAYRKRLAEAAAGQPDSGDAGTRSASGRIAPRVAAEAHPSAVGKDKLEVSRSDASGKAGASPQLQSRLAALEEDLVARDRALREANSRIAQLEKNLADLKKLAAMKSEAGAAIQAQAEANKAAPAPLPQAAPVVATPTAPRSAPAPSTTPPAPQPAAASTATSEPPKAEDAKPAPAPEAAPKPPPPKKKFVPPPPPPEPDFLEENGPMVFGGAGVLAALLGYLGFSAYRRKKAAKSAEEPAISQEDISRSSVFSETASASVAEPEEPASEFSISESGPDTGGAAVDPVVEAETYLAFGRDSQAEEILLDALKADPTRLPVQLKLLEIYSARRSAMQFNTLAAELKSQTGGSGADWDRVAAMGSAIDPDNALYRSGSDAEPAQQVPSPEPAAIDPEATMVFSAPPSIEAPAPSASPPPAAEEVAALDFDLDLGAESAPAPAPAQVAEAAAPALDDGGLGLDFDLGLDSTPVSATPDSPVAPVADGNLLDIDLELSPSTPVAEAAATALSEPAGLDLDLGGEQPAVVAEAIAPAGNSVDFSLDLELPASGQSPASTPTAAAEIDSGGIDFNFDLGDAPVAPPTEASTPAMPGLDLDLELTDGGTASGDAPQLPEVPSATDDSAGGEDNPEAATKLELAAAYEEMGDRDGARELLEEVLNEGSAAQRDQAKARLDALG